MKKIELSRRHFLIGSSAAVGALMLAPALSKTSALAKFETATHIYDGKTVLVKGIIKPRHRKVYEISISCDAVPCDLAINHVISRNNGILFALGLNARASMRWVATPDGEMRFGKDDVMRYEINPSHDGVQMCFHCEDDEHVKVAEYFRWEHDKLVATDVTPLDAHFDEWARYKMEKRVA